MSAPPRTGVGELARLGGLVDACAFPHVHADQPLDLALEHMGAARIDLLPVVARAFPRTAPDTGFPKCLLSGLTPSVPVRAPLDRIFPFPASALAAVPSRAEGDSPRISPL
jgi:hypothetical protein